MAKEITPAEVKEVMRRVKTGKQGGPDGVLPELIVWAGDGVIATIARFFEHCTRTKSFPTEWSQAEVVGMFKKGAAFDPTSYRPIALLSALYKLYAALLA
eukprot:13290346-Alexandrium_andersonii.AAC.1